MNIQWYPGHMTKARRMMEENIKLIDIVVELVDARIPLSSKNPDIDRLAVNKKRLIIMNKADLAAPSASELWKGRFEEQGYAVLLFDARNNQRTKVITDRIREVCKDKLERDARRGIKNRPIRAMVVGIPNVGKSTLINSLAGKKMAQTGNKPGVTKGKQWIKLNKEVELLDTPGILWPKFEDQVVGERLAFIGSVNDQIIQIEELAHRFLLDWQKITATAWSEQYGIEDDCQDPLTAIGLKRGCLKQGSGIDLHKTALLIFDEYRSGKLGRITLEMPESKECTDERA
ncbi:MAG: ribosome biogenesis GTPase YlqF [Lachnospiraceae bacterium]|nr:ribosome biogenesis GTPase YlqF [Lachnospiraceae bacterium]